DARGMSIDEQLIAAYTEAREDVYRYLLTFGLDPAAAQDAAQEVFMRLYTALRRGDAIASPRGWVFRAAHNLGIDLTRKVRELPLADHRNAVATDPRPDAQAMQKEQAMQVREAMSHLSPQQRQCLYLRAEGLKYREIAETMGIGVSTVSVFLDRALTR